MSPGPSTDRNTSVISSRKPIPQSEGLLSPGDPVDEQVAEILQNIVHAHEHALPVDQDESFHMDSEDEEHDEEVTVWKTLPWWKRPSPYWLIVGTPLASIGFSALIAPRVELYTVLACRAHAPEQERNDVRLVQPHSVLFANTTEIQDGFTLDVPFTAHKSVELVSVHIPASQSLSEQYTPDRNQCASDPVVQAAAAQLSAVLATSMGVLACFTTAWWGSLSDRLGRVPVMGISMLGLVINDLTFIITVFFMDHLPGGYWFLIVGFILEGLLGGMTTGVAASHAYLADSTHHSERSRIFSLSLGTMFGGVALGPVIGGILIRVTGSALSPFYLAATVHSLYATYVFLIVPESQTRARATGARYRREMSRERRHNGLSSVQFILKNTIRFLSPLAVLLPERVIIGGKTQKRSKRDWNLCYIAASYGMMTFTLGLVTYVLQYAAGTFKWSPETISYLVAFAGAFRALFLAVILPVIIKFLKPAPVQLPTTPDEPLQGLPPLSDSSRQSAAKTRTPSEGHTPMFDLNIARISLVLDIIAFLLQGLASSGLLFVCGTAIQSLGTGYSPALQAFALEVYSRRGGKGEAGKLFGAFSVVQAVGSQILGPALFGFIYYRTVATFPRAIFLVTAGVMMVSLVLLALVHLPSTGENDVEDANETPPSEAQVLVTRDDTYSH